MGDHTGPCRHYSKSNGKKKGEREREKAMVKKYKSLVKEMV